MDRTARPGNAGHLLTISVEDYFHSGSLHGVVAQKHWTRIESRLEKSIQQTLFSLLLERRSVFC